MTPQERDVIAGIFDRLHQAANQPRDPEAERYIADRLREQPYAPYAMAQAVYVQETALTNLQAQVEESAGAGPRSAEPPAEPACPVRRLPVGHLRRRRGRPEDAPARAGSVPSFPQRSQGQPSSAWTTTQAGAMQAAPAQGGMGQPGACPRSSPAPGATSRSSRPRPRRRLHGQRADDCSRRRRRHDARQRPDQRLRRRQQGGRGQAGRGRQHVGAHGRGCGNTQAASDNSTYNDGSSNEANYQNAGYDAPQDAGYDDGSSGFGGDDDSWA